MLTYRAILLAMLGVLIAAPVDAGPLRRLFGRSPACCPPQTYRAPAPCAPAPCVPCSFVRVKCPVWYLGDVDGLDFHFAEVFEVENGVCTLLYGDWLFADDPLTCPQTCPDGECLPDVVQVAKLRDPTIPADGEHKMPPGNHRPADRRTVVVENKNWVIKTYTYKVDLNNGGGKWKSITFGWHHKNAPIPADPEMVKIVKELPAKGSYLVEDLTGEKFPILVSE